MTSRRTLGVLMLLLWPMTGRAIAQEPARIAAELSAGWVGFADNAIVGEGAVGGSARWYASPRISLGPEVLYIVGDRHSHVMLTGNLTWDLVAATGGPPALTPFLVIGGGLFQTRERFRSETFTSSEGAFTAGGGIRAPLGDRATIGIDVRVGWELHLRVSGLAGVRIGE